ncbi:MAG: M3 family oligoendopeptidase [Chloroflexota bacterium]
MPQYRDLESRALTEATVEGFLLDWTKLSERVGEIEQRLHVATTRNTADEAVGRRYGTFIQEISPKVQHAEQRLKAKLLGGGLEPAGFEVPLRKMRVDAALFREENLPLQAEEKLLSEQYFKIVGAQTVEWEGKEIPVTQLHPVQEETERSRREQAWRLGANRLLQDREAIRDLWRKFLDLRRRMASNAGFPDYRSYRWQQFYRFDYTPEDAQSFHQAVEEVVVPVVARLRERRRRDLGVESLRPWDLRVDPLSRPPLRPFADVAQLEERAGAIFARVDPTLGEYFDTMRRDSLLDLGSRANKAPGGYCTSFQAAKVPFIFANAAGTAFDVETLLHEGGHAFHAFEMNHLPYLQQRDVPMEFAEVASMAMELLSEPYLPEAEGGFYSEAEAGRAQIDHLDQRVLTLWCRIASVDAFQHWIYEHPEEASDPAACDQQWIALQARFSPGVDWSGLEEEQKSEWLSVLHIHVIPFYMIDYGLAQLGAVQVWANARRDQAAAVAAYRHALSLGGTRSLPQLFTAAGARFGFDAGTIRSSVEVIEEALVELDTTQRNQG